MSRILHVDCRKGIEKIGAGRIGLWNNLPIRPHAFLIGITDTGQWLVSLPGPRWKWSWVGIGIGLDSVAESFWPLPGVAPRLSGHPTRRTDTILSYHGSTARLATRSKHWSEFVIVRELIIVSNICCLRSGIGIECIQTTSIAIKNCNISLAA